MEGLLCVRKFLHVSPVTQSGPPDLFCLANSILTFDAVFLNWQLSHKNNALALIEVRRPGCTVPAFPTHQFLGQLSVCFRGSTLHPVGTVPTTLTKCKCGHMKPEFGDQGPGWLLEDSVISNI